MPFSNLCAYSFMLQISNYGYFGVFCKKNSAEVFTDFCATHPTCLYLLCDCVHMCLYFVFKLHTLYIYNTDICTHSMQTYLLEIAYILSRYPYIFLFSCQYLSISMFAEYCAFCYIWIKIIGRIWFVCVNYSVYYLLVCLLR